ncbi:MAG: DNA repair protein RecO [Bacteroidetes bacterium]|nr:MAG: DNA repair protein RecO [Bacteroidota bacterium]REK35224.1 MAG: DNA repair protein RecO [Bacteroidota bacterium]REK48301.1 MAG: DNA repair protein RecO [Bacteroidota bacterium]
MLHKTRGIVLYTTDYSESSVIAKVYTELFGLQSYIVNGVRKSKAKMRASSFRPLTLVDLVVYHKEKGGLQRIADVRPNPVLNSIPYDVMKSSIALFLNEVLYKTIREEEANLQMFEFLFSSVQWLDVHEPVNSDFHLIFMLQLSKHLGFFPSDNYSEQQSLFDLQEGVFTETTPLHPFYLDKTQSRNLHILLSKLTDNSFRLNISVSEKRELIKNIIEFYRLHIPSIGEIKSHQVLSMIWE